MARKSSNSTEAKARRREQNRLAQRRFRQKHCQQKTIDPERVRSPTPNAPACSETQTTSDSSPNTPAVSPMASVNPTTHGHTPRIDAIDPSLFLDSFDFDATNTLFTSALNSVDPVVQLTPAASDSAAQLPKVSQYSQSAIPSDIINGGETVHCNHGINTSKGADSGHGNTLGRPSTSPLQRAIQKGHSKIIKLLLDHHADYNEKDSEGRTPLINATIAGFEDVVDMLLSHGAGLEYVDHQHRSPLHWAVIRRQDRILKIFLRHCAGNRKLVNECTKDGRTPLLIAIDTGFDAAVEALLESGADV